MKIRLIKRGNIPYIPGVSRDINHSAAPFTKGGERIEESESHDLECVEVEVEETIFNQGECPEIPASTLEPEERSTASLTKPTEGSTSSLTEQTEWSTCSLGSQAEWSTTGSTIPKSHFLLHLPAHPDCPTCRQAKQRRAAARPQKPEERDMATRFGGRISFDHAIVGNIPGVAGFRTGLHIDDEASNFQQFFPAKTRSTHEVEYALRTFIGKQTDQVEELYSDNAPEYVKSVRNLRLNSRRSTPRRPTSNARKERKMQVFGDAVATALHQAAMPLSMWPLAGAYVCNVENFVGEEEPVLLAVW